MKRINFADAPRGAVVETPQGQSAWCGSDWEIEAGPAIVTTSLGTPNRVTNCRFPDGSRGEAMLSIDHHFSRLLDSGPTIWKRRHANGGWIFGTIEIGNTDVFFSDRPDIARSAKGTLEGLEKDLAGDARILVAVQDDGFAGRLYSALCNTSWTKDGESWDCSWRYAGGLVADLRGRNESYTDFYCRGVEGVVAEDVGRDLARLGWTLQENDA